MKPGILYLHGFASSPASWKARALAEALNVRGLGDRLHCPALSPVPREAIAQAEAILAANEEPLCLVGSSLGGFYATYLAEQHDRRAVLINPAVAAPRSLQKYIGRQSNLSTGESFDFTTEHVTQLRALELERITPARYLLLVETGDEVLDYRQAVARYAGSQQVVREGGDHSFTRFVDVLPRLLDFCGLRDE